MCVIEWIDEEEGVEAVIEDNRPDESDESAQDAYLASIVEELKCAQS